jgi:hypothetical protein
MRGISAIVVFLGVAAARGECAAQLRVSRDPTADEQAVMDELGKMFLGAGVAGDDNAALGCWMKAEVLEPEVRKWLKPEEVAEFWKYLKNRDEVAAAYVPLLKRFLERDAGGEKLKFQRLTGRMEYKLGLVQTTAFFLTFSGPEGAEYRYRIDDGILWEGAWYFQDKPEGAVDVRRNGKSVRVQLTDYATEAEREKIKALQDR